MLRKLLLPFCFAVILAHAHPQAIDPAYQVNWPSSCTTGLVYSPTANVCVPGTATIIDVTLAGTGSDIGAKINSALTSAACNTSCTMFIPAGTYNFSTQIVLPYHLFGTYKLQGSPGAVLTWTGTGDAIVAQPGYIGDGNLIIEGFQLVYGGSGTLNGIHLYPTNRVTVQNMVIYGFSHGSGIKIEGLNSSNILNNLIFNNQNGVELLSTFCTGSSPTYTCNPGNYASGTLYAANAINIEHNQITDNGHWGVILDDSPGNGDSGALNDNISFNDLELNGTSGSTYGALYSGKSTGLLVEHNYFEGSPRQIVLGLYDGSAGDYYGTTGASIRDNYFTTLGAYPYNIELENSGSTTIIGNTEQGGAGVGSSNCFVNAATGGEIRTLLIPTGIIQGISVGNRLCINGSPAQTFVGSGSFVLFNTNYKVGIAYAGFVIGSGTSDTQAATNVATTSTCFAQASNNAAQATAQSLIASIYVQPGNGSFTIFHPSGHSGLLYDVYCTQALN
jgi:hypothetical protein